MILTNEEHMSGKVTKMSTIKQLLLQHQQGASNREIADCLDINRGTVNDYVAKIKAYSLNITELLSLPEPILESRFKVGIKVMLLKPFNSPSKK